MPDVVREYLAMPATASDGLRITASDLFQQSLSALAAGDEKTAVDAIRGSLETNPHDPDSLQLFIDLASDNAAETIAALRLIVDAAAADLGESTFRDDVGHFWGRVETRPFMRAKERLALELRDNDDHNEAIEHLEELLALNPNDNQGNRYALLGLYLADNRREHATGLLAEYDEPSAVWAWSRLLLLVLENDTDDCAQAEETLKQAREINPYVAPLLLGALEPPPAMPNFHSPGGPNEAIIAQDTLQDAWLVNDAAPLRWLAERVSL